jgi:hypothetical protein
VLKEAEMKAMAVPTTTYIGYRTEKDTGLRRSRTNWFALMLISGATAVGAGITGLAVGSVAWEFPGSGLSPAATILLAISFPFFFLMSHCMDKIGEIEKAIRLNYCRQNGLRDEDLK